MIRKIKNKVKRFEQDNAGLQRLLEDQMALAQLHKMFDDGVFLPLTSWSISPREVLHACNEIVINNRHSVVEFGSGFSTLCIARMLKITGRATRFVTVESNAAWAAELSKILVKMGLSAFVNIIVAPLAPVSSEFSKGDQSWYDTSAIAPNIGTKDKIDMVIVDGPHGATCQYARFPAIPFLKNYLADDFVIFLDDSSRPEEQQIAMEWKKLLGAHLRDYHRYVVIGNAASGFDPAPFGLTKLCNR